MEFARKLPEPISILSPWSPGPIPAPASVVTQQEEQAKVSTEMDELLLREEQLAELLITDPVAYEELVRNGELEDVNEPNNA